MRFYPLENFIPLFFSKRNTGLDVMLKVGTLCEGRSFGCKVKVKTQSGLKLQFFLT